MKIRIKCLAILCLLSSFVQGASKATINEKPFVNDHKVDRKLQHEINQEKYLPISSSSPSENLKKKRVYIFKGRDWGPLFPKEDSPHNRDNCLAPLIALKENLKNHDIELLDVSSLKNLEPALGVIAFDIPSKEELEEFLKYPYEARRLILWEPPSTRPDIYNKRIHEYFYRVYTWDDQLVDNKRYFKFHYPHLREMIQDVVPFEKRKLCCAISNNKGSYHPNELYAERVRAYRFFDQKCPTEFSLFGNWGEKSQFKTYQGTVRNKAEVLRNYKFCICYENIKDLEGYITEKIFDVFHAGCVPIYLGAKNISEEVSSECFIDRRKFSSDEELYQFLISMTKEDYEQYLVHIRDYFNSTKALQYSKDAFVRKFSAELLKDKAPFYFCTAADSKYYSPLLNLIGSLHKCNFERVGEVAVFDLGLLPSQIEHLNSIEKTRVYKLELTHPDLLKQVKTRIWGKEVPGWYAWKPVCIKQGLEIYPDLLWIDGGTTIKRRIDPLFDHMRKEGYFFHNGCDWPVKRHLTRYLISKFNLNQPEYSWILAENTYGLEAGLMGITRVVEFDFVRPIYELSKNLKNFEDDGTTPGGFGEGRHDLSVFSIYALKNGYKIFHHFDQPNKDLQLAEGIPFHISCIPEDCKVETHIYHSRNLTNLRDNVPFIHFKGENPRYSFQHY